MIPLLLLMAVAGFNAADAQQILVPGSPSLLPPPPPSPPPPKITVPVVPKMDELPDRNYVTTPTRPSFGDRITTCLQAGAAAGLGPNERADYSRACANRD